MNNETKTFSYWFYFLRIGGLFKISLLWSTADRFRKITIDVTDIISVNLTKKGFLIFI